MASDDLVAAGGNGSLLFLLAPNSLLQPKGFQNDEDVLCSLPLDQRDAFRFESNRVNFV